MSVTDELRRLLDEHGIEHYDHDHRDVRVTEWDNGGKRDARYEEWSSGTVRFDASNVTAEQAIAATVGRGTCRFNVVFYKDFATPRQHGNICKCDACGYQHLYGLIIDARFKYCPNCGARIEAVE